MITVSSSPIFAHSVCVHSRCIHEGEILPMTTTTNDSSACSTTNTNGENELATCSYTETNGQCRQRPREQQQQSESTMDKGNIEQANGTSNTTQLANGQLSDETLPLADNFEAPGLHMIPLLRLITTIKTLVSKKKSRFRDGVFDLDLSYITKNIIAMGFPACTLEGIYRNHIHDVANFFQSRHSKHFLIFNLCAESQRRYDSSIFEGSVETSFTFHDHNPPAFAYVCSFCKKMADWLKADPLNVAAVHCKAGKGRTGVMVCAYLVHAGLCHQPDGKVLDITSAHHALQYYGKMRTSNGKGVTIQSQRRYVFYYDELVKRAIKYEPQQLKLVSLILANCKPIASGSVSLGCEIFQISECKHAHHQPLKTFKAKISRQARHFVYDFKDIFLSGDIKLQFSVNTFHSLSRQPMYQLCFNTLLVKYSTDIFSLAVQPCMQCEQASLEVVVLGTKNHHLDTTQISAMDLTFLNTVHARDYDGRASFCHCRCPLLAANHFFSHQASTTTFMNESNGKVRRSSSVFSGLRRMFRPGVKLEGAHHMPVHARHLRQGSRQGLAHRLSGTPCSSHQTDSSELSHIYLRNDQTHVDQPTTDEPSPERGGVVKPMRKKDARPTVRWIYMVALLKNMDKSFKYSGSGLPKFFNHQALQKVLSQVVLKFEDDKPGEELDILEDHTFYGKQVLEQRMQGQSVSR